MAVNLKGRNFLKMLDFNQEEIMYLLDLSRKLKADKMSGVETKQMSGKNVVLLFKKDSTRTRCAFEVGAHDQGASTTYMGPTGSHIGKKESIADTARVLSRMYDGIEFRGSEHSVVEDLAKYSHVPVWNGLTDEWHPTQMLADFMTMQEHRGRNLSGLKFAYLGDARNNMAHSYIIMSAKMGVEIRIGAPKVLWPDEKIVKAAKDIFNETGGKVLFLEDPKEAVKDCDFITTDVWVSMGEPKEKWKERIDLLKPYQVNSELVKHAKEDFIFLHCLPSFHNTDTEVGKQIVDEFGFGENGLEVTNDIFESSHSKVFEEAENRLHTIKAIMVATIGNV